MLDQEEDGDESGSAETLGRFGFFGDGRAATEKIFEEEDQQGEGLPLMSLMGQGVAVAGQQYLSPFLMGDQPEIAQGAYVGGQQQQQQGMKQQPLLQQQAPQMIMMQPSQPQMMHQQPHQQPHQQQMMYFMPQQLQQQLQQQQQQQQGAYGMPMQMGYYPHNSPFLQTAAMQPQQYQAPQQEQQQSSELKTERNNARTENNAVQFENVQFTMPQPQQMALPYGYMPFGAGGFYPGTNDPHGMMMGYSPMYGGPGGGPQFFYVPAASAMGAGYPPHTMTGAAPGAMPGPNKSSMSSEGRGNTTGSKSSNNASIMATSTSHISQSEGDHERRKRPASSKYRGVSWHKRDKRWLARAWVNGKTENLGSFCSEEEAAFVVDERTLQVSGPGTRKEALNFPNDETRQKLKQKYSTANQVLSKIRKRKPNDENKKESADDTKKRRKQAPTTSTAEDTV